MGRNVHLMNVTCFSLTLEVAERTPIMKVKQISSEIRERTSFLLVKSSHVPLVSLGGKELPVALRLAQRDPLPSHPAGLRPPQPQGSAQPPGGLQEQQARGGRRPIPQPVRPGDLDHPGLRQLAGRRHLVLG